MFSAEKIATDYWYDAGVVHASSLLEKFTDADWAEVLDAVDGKDDLWLLRFCEVIGDFSDKQALLVLLRVLALDSEEVVCAALDSIRSMVYLGVDVSMYLSAIETAIERGKSFAGSVGLVSIMDLERVLLKR